MTQPITTTIPIMANMLGRLFPVLRCTGTGGMAAAQWQRLRRIPSQFVYRPPGGFFVARIGCKPQFFTGFRPFGEVRPARQGAFPKPENFHEETVRNFTGEG